MTWTTISDETPKGEFVLTRKHRRNLPDYIVSAAQMPGTITLFPIWKDANGAPIPQPDEWMEIPE